MTMFTHAMTAFSTHAQRNPQLQQLLQAAGSALEIASIANDNGFSVATEEIEAMMNASAGPEGELSDEQLALVDGGVIFLIVLFAKAGQHINQGGYMDKNNKL